MSAKEHIKSPDGFVPLDNETVKLTALFAFLLCVFFATYGNPILIFVLSADLLLGSLNLYKVSPLVAVADTLIKILAIESAPVDVRPLKFAARFYLAIALLVIILWYTGYPVFAINCAAVLSLLSFIESSTGFSAGYYLSIRFHRLFNTESAVDTQSGS